VGDLILSSAFIILHPGIIYLFHFFISLSRYKMANELKVIVYMTTIIASGYALMKYTVPDEETMKKV
jgi:hypothetical protein